MEEHGAFGGIDLTKQEGPWFKYFSKRIPNFLLRCVVMCVGLSLIGLGIALGKFSAIGTSPISCIPAVLFDYLHSKDISSISMGTLTFGINLMFLALEIALLRRKFKLLQLLQLAALVVMTASIDVWLGLLEANVTLGSYADQLVFVVLSFVVQALGVFLEVGANVLMVPGEGIVKVVSYVSGRKFKNCKTAFDSTLIVIASVMSFLLMHGLYGVREGSVLSAIFTGQCVGLWAKLLRHFNVFLPPAAPVFPPIVSSNH